MAATRSMFAVAALLLAAAPGAGSAQERTDLLSPAGEYFLVGGGWTNFAKAAMRDRFDVGGGWDVRVGVGERYYVGGELAYVGSARKGIHSEPNLMGDGAEGVLRLQVPTYASGWLVEPFAFGGLGWSHVRYRTAMSGLKRSDDIGTVPFGAGLTLGYDRFLVDARFTYRAAFSETLSVAPGEKASLQQWAIGAAVGWEF